MPQYFIKSKHIDSGRCHIIGDDFHHLVNVRRVSLGDEVLLRDENGVSFHTEVLSIGDEHVNVKIVETEKKSQDNKPLHLYLSLLKGKKFDLVLQKIVEIGVDRITPIITERTVSDFKSKNKLDRWEKIILEASKQSLRRSLPTLDEPKKIEDCFNEALGTKIIAHTDGEKKLSEVINKVETTEIVSLFVGPEGGFSEKEITIGLEKGCELVIFGENHLRAETAGIVLPALIQYERGLM